MVKTSIVHIKFRKQHYFQTPSIILFFKYFIHYKPNCHTDKLINRYFCYFLLLPTEYTVIIKTILTNKQMPSVRVVNGYCARARLQGLTISPSWANYRWNPPISRNWRCSSRFVRVIKPFLYGFQWLLGVSEGIEKIKKNSKIANLWELTLWTNRKPFTG